MEENTLTKPDNFPWGQRLSESKFRGKVLEVKQLYFEYPKLKASPPIR
jgi:hypothetical protein